MTEQLDLTEHVFRSVRGWLHQLYPEDHILIERRTDEYLNAADETAETPTEPRPLWNLALAAGPIWAEHTAGSSMVSYRITALRAATDVWDGQRTVGRLVANATRPGGRIPLYGYNLTHPQQPNITNLDGAGVWPSGSVDVAVAAVDANGDQVTQPCLPVTAVVSAGTELVVEPMQWPHGSTVAASWAIYAAEAGETVTLQTTVQAGETATLAALIEGTTSPTNLRTPLLGMRVSGAEGETRQPSTEGAEVWEAVVTLPITVQVPRILAAHLDPVLTP